MRHLLRALVIAVACGLIPIALTAHQLKNPKLTNPVAADAASLAAGKQVYDRQCASCHGDHGKGDGPMGEEMNPGPGDLSGADWKHGSSDAEVFAVIRDGVKYTGMRAYGRKLTTHQMWDVVNYVRGFRPRTH